MWRERAAIDFGIRFEKKIDEQSDIDVQFNPHVFFTMEKKTKREKLQKQNPDFALSLFFVWYTFTSAFGFSNQQQQKSKLKTRLKSNELQTNKSVKRK